MQTTSTGEEMSTYRIEKINTALIIICDPTLLINSEKVALEMVTACGENETDRLLFTWHNLPEDFYNLRTGLAGEVLQKLATYFIRAAFVLPGDFIKPVRFSELVYELNKGMQFRFFCSQSAALNWLSTIP